MNQVQSCILNIFKDVVKVCEAEHLKYFAIGGTCLGAVRHNGFIPWDDDMDIAMPIDDFNRFCEIAPLYLPNYMELRTPSDAPHDVLRFAKVIDSRTTMTEEKFLRWNDMHSGVWLDIMPLSGIPDDEREKNKFFRKKARYERANYKIRTDIDFQKTVSGKVYWALLHSLKRIIGPDFFWKKWLSLMSKTSIYETNYTGYIWSDKLKKLTFKSEWFRTYDEHPFEDTVIRLPIGWDNMLTQMFGDYMKLPKLEDQMSNHITDNHLINLHESYHQKNN